MTEHRKQIDQLPQDEHHSGRPMTTLDTARDKHNIVAAVRDIESARQLIVDLERAGITPSHISLLGAWPVEGAPSPPHSLQVTALRTGATYAVAGVAATALLKKRASRLLLLVGGLVAALGGVAIALARNTGESQAWKETLVADDSGTASVGVHSPDRGQVVTAERVMHEVGVLHFNRFEGRYR